MLTLGQRKKIYDWFESKGTSPYQQDKDSVYYISTELNIPEKDIFQYIVECWENDYLDVRHCSICANKESFPWEPPCESCIDNFVTKPKSNFIEDTNNNNA